MLEASSASGRRNTTPSGRIHPWGIRPRAFMLATAPTKNQWRLSKRLDLKQGAGHGADAGSCEFFLLYSPSLRVTCGNLDSHIAELARIPWAFPPTTKTQTRGLRVKFLNVELAEKSS